MDVRAYRADYERQLSGAAASAGSAAASPARSVSPTGSPNLADRIPALLQALEDPAQPVPARVGALLALCAARFLGARFAAHRAAFHDILRKLATKDTVPELRVPAIEALAQANDASTQQVLKDGLLDPTKALVDPIKALQLLSEDEHSGVSRIAFDLFHRTDDLPLKEAALRAMSSAIASQDLFAQLIADKSQPRSLRALSAAGLGFINPDRFAAIAKDIVHDGQDFPEIRATVLGALANGHSHQQLKADPDFLGQILKLGASEIDLLRQAAVRFLGHP